jgi:transcriptional regulator with XRE-family HTH domain
MVVETEIELGERIARWRESRDLTQAALAAKLGLTAGAVANWEVSTATPTQANLQKLVDALDITMAQFWGRVPAKRRKAS